MLLTITKHPNSCWNLECKVNVFIQDHHYSYSPWWQPISFKLQEMFTSGQLTYAFTLLSLPAVPYQPLADAFLIYRLVIQVWLKFLSLNRNSYINKYFASHNPCSTLFTSMHLKSYTSAWPADKNIIIKTKQKTAWYINKIYIGHNSSEVYNYRFKTLCSINATLLICISHDLLTTSPLSNDFAFIMPNYGHWGLVFINCNVNNCMVHMEMIYVQRHSLLFLRKILSEQTRRSKNE